MTNHRNAYWFTVGQGIHKVTGHSCAWCHRWIKTGEEAYYQSAGDCGSVYCKTHSPKRACSRRYIATMPNSGDATTKGVCADCGFQLEAHDVFNSKP
jgi:hypothetical protein